MSTPPRADRPIARSDLPEVLARLVDRTVGGLKGETGRVAATTQVFLIFALALSVGYAVFFTTYDMPALAPMVLVTIVCALVYVAGIATVRLGHQFLASLIALTTCAVQILVVTRYVGWETGLHLYLIAGGQLVFMVFTERQRAMRGVFMVIAIATFTYCQLVVDQAGGSYTFPDSALSVLFPVNATLTLLLMFALAWVAHRRANVAREEAANSAARAEYLANTDALTGLANRRPVLERLEQLSAPGVGHYCLAIADLDHFKALNDTFGHTCGDRVLNALGERLRLGLRATDAVGRWGGEEFIFVMADASINDAVTMMERLRLSLAHHPIPCTGHSHDVTMSVGVADGADDQMGHRVIKRADDALYEAKQGGRNQVRANPANQQEPEGEPDAAGSGRARLRRS